MAFFDNFPYTNFHRLNLDWVVSEIKKFREQYEHIQEQIDAGVLILDNKTEEDIETLNAEFVRLQEEITTEVDDSFLEFSSRIIAEANRVIATIPGDYTAVNRSLFTALLISTNQLISYDYVSKVLNIPAGTFCIYNGVPHALTAQINVNVSDYLLSDACNLWMLSDYSIVATPFTSRPADISARYIGSIYDKDVFIIGVPSQFIKIIFTGSYIEPFYPDNKGSFIGIEEQTRTIVIDFNSKTITFPGGFKVYRGRSTAYAGETIPFTDTTANKIYMRRDKTLYCRPWINENMDHSDDDCIGFFYYETAWIAGVPNNCFEIIPVTHKGDVYVFGDSIPAGTGTTRNFTMYMHDFDRKLRFLNYAVGSTGYYTNFTGTSVAGDGTEANGTSGEQSGNNNVYNQIDAIENDIPAMVIASGTNDWSANVAALDFRNAVQDALDLALTKSNRVFVLLPIKREDWATATNTENLKLENYSEIIKEECIKRSIPFFDGFEIFLDPSVADNKTNFVPDGLHPNDLGHKRIARTIYNTVLETVCYY